MTSQTAPAPKITGPEAALDAATQKTSAASAALEKAEKAIPAAEQALVDAESNLVDVLANASGTTSRTEIARARTAVEKSRADIEWAGVQHKAAELAYFRAVEAEVVARRAVIAQEYIAEHKRYTGPDNREPILRAQIEAAIAELVTLIADRHQLHGRLLQEIAHFPDNEQLQLPARGRGLSAPRPSWYAGLPVTVPYPELQKAIETGLSKGNGVLRERERAARFG